MIQPEEQTNLKQLQICCSSFDVQNKNLFRELINKLNGIHNDDLNLDTNVLIAKTVLSPKYTAASIINIPMVTEKWLFDSFQAGYFLAFSNYLLPCFAGLHIGVLGFNEQENEELKQLIEEQEGSCYWNHHKIIDEKICHVIILKQKQAKFYESCIDALDIPVISIEWLKQCLIQEHYLNTTRYLINPNKRFAPETRISCDENIVNKVLSEYECSEEPFNYLQRCIICFHKIGEKTEKIQRKLIAAGGGFFIKDFLPSVTHVITENYTEDVLSEFKKYSNTKIVSLSWLADCFIYRRRLPEEDYYVRPTSSNLVLDERSKTMGRVNSDTRMSFDSSFALSRQTSYGINTQPKGLLRRASSVFTEQVGQSLPSTTLQKDVSLPATTTAALPAVSKSAQKVRSPIQVRGKSRKSQPKVLSNILKDCNFFLDSSLNELADKYHQKIVENGGKVIPTLNEFEEIYWVMADCPDSKIKAQKHAKKQNVKIISWRWIDSSLSKKRQINNIIEDALLQYLPLPHSTPFEDFKNKTVFAAGFEPRRKGILKEILQILGATVVYDPKKLDVLIVSKKDSKKYMDICKNYKHIPIVQESWVFTCVEEGKFLETSRFASV